MISSCAGALDAALSEEGPPVFVEDLRREHGHGMSEAVLLREYQLPSHRVPRVMALEQRRPAWHDDARVSQAGAVLDHYRAGLRDDPMWQSEGEADLFLS